MRNIVGMRVISDAFLNWRRNDLLAVAGWGFLCWEEADCWKVLKSTSTTLASTSACWENKGVACVLNIIFKGYKTR